MFPFVVATSAGADTALVAAACAIAGSGVRR
jgi:hypothetical protein